MNRKTFAQWSEPYIKACKARDIKLSNKNLAKLRDGWVNWCLRTYAKDISSQLSVLFWCTYQDKIEQLIPDSITFFKKISKDDGVGFNIVSKDNIYNNPITLGFEHGVVYGISEEE